jgi:hypothetical protein
MLVVLALLLLAGGGWAEDKMDFEFNGKCPHCRALGLKSIVHIGACFSTLLFCGNGHYDEDGNYHSPDDCNSTSCEYTCSNGHKFYGGMFGSGLLENELK